jgi:hypothetical protein
MPETKRLQMMINGEAVAEIDIKASFLTIYHARLGVPLKHTTDPYVEARIQDRSIAKSWVVHSFGKSSPQVRWGLGRRLMPSGDFSGTRGCGTH